MRSKGRFKRIDKAIWNASLLPISNTRPSGISDGISSFSFFLTSTLLWEQAHCPRGQVRPWQVKRYSFLLSAPLTASFFFAVPWPLLLLLSISMQLSSVFCPCRMSLGSVEVICWDSQGEFHFGLQITLMLKSICWTNGSVGGQISIGFSTVWQCVSTSFQLWALFDLIAPFLWTDTKERTVQKELWM